jgi:Ran GTPase-activating protein (RanGAP) involved in mRNA processing and transport
MLRRTSKRVKEAVDKMRLPAVVRLSRSFWNDTRIGTAAAKIHFVMRQLTLMTGCRISTLELPHCGMKGQDAKRLAEVLAQCTALAHLNLSGNYKFNFWGNRIGPDGAESLAGVLAQCASLAHLNLRGNHIGAVGGRSLGASWRGQAAGLLFENDEEQEEDEDEIEETEEEEEEEEEEEV